MTKQQQQQQPSSTLSAHVCVPHSTHNTTHTELQNRQPYKYVRGGVQNAKNKRIFDQSKDTAPIPRIYQGLSWKKNHIKIQFFSKKITLIMCVSISWVLYMCAFCASRTVVVSSASRFMWYLYFFVKFSYNIICNNRFKIMGLVIIL